MRPPTQGPDMVARDVQDLVRIQRRALASKRSEKEKKRLVRALKVAQAILLGSAFC
jgi:hypothetical protein